MTLDQWLREATGTFPGGVQKRLGQEYRAHMADSILAGKSTDARELFGDPNTIRKNLKKLYIEDKRLRSVRKRTGMRFWFMSLIVLLLMFDRVSRLSNIGIIGQAIVVTLFFSSFLIVCLYTRKWQEERRIFFRDAFVNFIVVFYYVVSSFFDSNVYKLPNLFFLPVIFYLEHLS